MGDAKENSVSTGVNLAKQAIHDKLEFHIKTAEAKLEMLKAQAEVAKANIEIKAVAELLTKRQVLERELKGLRKLGGDRWEHAKADLEARIADFEELVRDIESKAKAS